jgi:uncharacterized protein involved in exopolysaccharide biosynthesis
LHEDDDAAAIRWLGVMAHAWGILAIGALIGGLVGFAAALRTPPLFEAVATVFLNPPRSNPDLFTTAAMRTIFSNPSVSSDVVRELGIDRPPHSLTPGRFQTRALTVEDVPNSYLARVKVRLPDPELAATAANRVAERLSDLTSRIWTDWIKAERAQLERQTEEARLGLARAEQEWLAARLATPDTSVHIDVPRAVMTESLIPFQGSAQKPSPSKQPTLEDRLAESRKRGALAQEARKRLKPSEIALGKAYGNEFELVRLENEVELRRTVFMEFGARLQATGVELASTPRPLRVLDRAAVPNYPLPGTRTRTVALGLLGGLILAACLVVAREWRTQPN